MVNSSQAPSAFSMLHASLLRQGNDTGHCPTLLNSSCSVAYDSDAAYVLLYTLAATVVLFTMCGNLCVIISVSHFKQLHTPTNVLILSLALSDFLVGMFQMPVHSRFWIEPCSLFHSSLCIFSNVIGFHVTFVSIYNICFIAIDRYLALSSPFLYCKKVSVCLACLITTHVWVVSLLYNGALLYFNGNLNPKCPSRCRPSMSGLWSTVDLITVFVLPCVTIITLYMKVFFIARRHAVAIRATRTSKDNNNYIDSVRSEGKAARVLGTLVMVFLICLIPYYVCTLMFDVLGQSYDRVVSVTLVLFCLNSSINPLIYALFYPWFQKSVKLILICRICSAHSSHINVLSGDR